MTGRTRYGDLLRAAAWPVAAASAGLSTERFPDRTAAREALVAYRDLLHALNRHGWALFGPTVRLEGMRESATPDPHGLAAARMLQELQSVGRAARIDRPNPASLVAANWARAAASVRSATDLLATHRDRRGLSRSPQAALIDDPAVRAAGLTELAGLVVPVAEAGSDLGLRSGQAGVAWGQVHRFVPDTADLRREAMHARGGTEAAGDATPLADLEVARPAVRTEDPVLELGDRLARLHRIAWQLTAEPRVGVGTLADFAVVGVIMNEHVARFLRPPDGTAPPPSPKPGANPALDSFQRAAAAWRLVHLHLLQMRTTTPAHTGVRADVHAIRRLLGTSMQLTAAESTPLPARFASLLIGSARAFGQVGVWNAQVLERQARTGLLFTPGRSLTRDEVTDKPELIGAKLKGSVARTPLERVDHLRAAYTTIRKCSTIAARTCHGKIAPGNERTLER